MTMLPDIDQTDYDEYERQRLQQQFEQQNQQFALQQSFDQQNAQLQAIATPPPAPPSSDSLTNPTGTRFLAPATPDEPPEVTQARQQYADQGQATPPPEPAPPPPAAPAPAPEPQPAPSSSPSPSASSNDSWFGQVLGQVAAAGGNVQQFASSFDPGAGLGSALGAAHAAGANVQQFASTLQAPTPTAPEIAAGQGAPGGVRPSGTPTSGVPGWLNDLIQRNAPGELASDPDFIRTVAAGAKAESGWNINAVQQGGGGRGLFQFDLGGMGAGIPEAQLLGSEGAEMQASRIIPLYAKAYQSAPQGLSGAEKASWVAAQAERPYQFDNPQSAARRNYASAYSDISGPPGTAPQDLLARTGAWAQQAAAQPASQVSQFGQPQLSNDEAYAACGPAAAVRFASMYGRNPTLREATDLAATVGWTSGAGMAGLGSEKALMDKMGVATRAVGPDVGAMAREAQTGNPVTISTQNHYFFADGYDPQSGAFHVGQSGLDLKGGSEWMTPDQMQALQGRIQGALFADNPQVPTTSTADQGSLLDRLGQAKDTVTGAVGSLLGQDTGQNLPTVNPVTGRLEPGSPGGPPQYTDFGKAAALSGPQSPQDALGGLGQAALSKLTDFGNLGKSPERIAAEQEAYRQLGTNPDYAASQVQLPQNPLDVLGAAGQTEASTLSMPEYQRINQQRRAAIEEANPLRDVTLLGGLVNMAGDIATDPLTYITGGPITAAGKAAERAVVERIGHPIIAKIAGAAADQATQGALYGATQGGLEEPGATPLSVAQSVGTGAALGGLTGLAGAGGMQALRGVAGQAGRGLEALERRFPPAEAFAAMPDVAEEATEKAFTGPIADRLAQVEGAVSHPDDVAQAAQDLAQLSTRGERVIGMPDQYATPEGLAGLRDRLRVFAEEGASQKDWYSDSSQAILDAVQGDKVQAEKLAQLVAIYSPNTPVDANMANALMAWYQHQAGQPIKVAMESQDRRAQELLQQGLSWEGRKTNNFYRNLMQHIDPEVYAQMGKETGQSGVTADIWMMRAFNYLAGQNSEGRMFLKSPSDQQYNFIQDEISRLGKQYGWTPEQTQAAVWSGVKAAAEGTNVEQAGFHYGSALENRMAQVSSTASPGTSAAQAIPGYMDAPEHERAHFNIASDDAMRDPVTGRDVVAEEFGIPRGERIIAPEVYGEYVGPGFQHEVPVPQARTSRTEKVFDAEGNPVIDPETGKQAERSIELRENRQLVQEPARWALNAYAAARGILLKQDAVPWTRIFRGNVPQRDANAAVLQIGRPLTSNEAAAINDALSQTLGPDAHAVVATGDGAWILNLQGRFERNPEAPPNVIEYERKVQREGPLREGERKSWAKVPATREENVVGTWVPDPDPSVPFRSNEDFYKQVNQALSGVELEDGRGANISRARADSEYVANDWEANPNGEAYRSLIESAGRTAAFRKLENPVSRRIQQAQADVAARYGWPSNPNNPSVGRPGGGAVPGGRLPASANALFATHLGGGAAGALTGYATAPEDATQQERLQRAALFGAAGLAGTGALARYGPGLAERGLGALEERFPAQDVYASTANRGAQLFDEDGRLLGRPTDVERQLWTPDTERAPSDLSQLVSPAGNLLSTVAGGEARVRGGKPAWNDIAGISRTLAGSEPWTLNPPSEEARKAMPNLLHMANGSPEIQATLQRVAEDNPDLIRKYTQGVITHDQLVKDTANKLGMTADDFLKTRIGQAFNPQELLALRGTIEHKHDELAQMTAEIQAKGGAKYLNPEERLGAVRKMLEAAQLQAIGRGAVATAGRALNQQKINVDRGIAAMLTRGNELRSARQALTAARAKQAWANSKLGTPLEEAGGSIGEAAAQRARDRAAIRSARAEPVTGEAMHAGGAQDDWLKALQDDLKATNNYDAKTWDQTMKDLDAQAAKKFPRDASAEGQREWLAAQARVAQQDANRENQRAIAAWNRQLAEGDTRRNMASKILERVGGENITNDMIDNLVKVMQSDDKMAAAKYLQSLQKVSWWDRLSTMRYASMLSSTATHTAQALSNTGQLGMALATHPGAVAFDIAASALGGGERTRYMSELPAMLRGIIGQAPSELEDSPYMVRGAAGGLRQGAADAAEIMRSGLNPSNISRNWEQVAQPGFGFEQTALGKAIGPRWSGAANFLAEGPLRTLEAGDSLIRGAARGAFAHGLAERQAIREGYQGAAKRARVDEIVRNFDEFPELFAQADDAAKRVVLQEQRPGGLASGLMSARRGPEGLALSMIMPFVRTPWNVAAQGAGLTPLGYLGALKAAANGERGEAVDRAARATLGTGILGGATMLGANGYLTGGTPTDPSEKSSLEPNWQPYALRVPHEDGSSTYIKYSNMGPVGVPLAAGAILGDAYKHAQAQGQQGLPLDVGQTVFKMTGGMGRYMIDQTMLQGLANTLDMLGDPERKAQNFFEGLTTQFAPYAALGRQLDRALGTGPRDTREGFQGLLDAVLSSYPGASGLVPQRLDPLGRNVQETQTGLGALVSPARYTQSPYDPLTEAMRNADVGVGATPKSWRNFALNEQEQRQYQQQSGYYIDQMLRDVINDPAFQRAPIAERQIILQRVIAAARNAGGADIVSQLSDEQLMQRYQQEQQRTAAVPR